MQKSVLNTFLILIFLLASIADPTFAQSDYQLTQNFKNKYRGYEKSTEQLKTIKELRELKKEIEEFRREYISHKQLLDRALFPNNFESSFKKLNRKLNLAEEKIAVVKNLQEEVDTFKITLQKLELEIADLSGQISQLSKDKNKLLSQIRLLKLKPEQDKNTIDSLNKLVTLLKNNINKRDNLIMAIIDSIFMKTSHKISTMHDAEKREISSTIQSSNLFMNIRTLLIDNIRFIEVSRLKSGDLNEMKENQIDFEEKWKIIGPKLADIYSSDQSQKTELEEIDSLLIGWHKTTDGRIWQSIDSLFRKQNISLDYYSTGNEFHRSILSFIKNELGNINDESFNTYDAFTNKVWNEDITNVWMPILLDHNLITEIKKKEIEDSLLSWGASIEEPFSIWLYILLALAFIGITIIFITYVNTRKRGNDRTALNGNNY